MRVVMPVLTYVPDAMGGSETYAKALVAGLEATADIDLTVISSSTSAGALGVASEHVVRAVRGEPTTSGRLVAVARSLAADTTARRLLREADVVHYPFTVPVPLNVSGTPWVQTLLDVQHRDLPQMFTIAERIYRAVSYDAPARRATRVVTLSEFCRGRIESVLGVPAERIDVAHLGVDLARFVAAEGARQSFVLYPASAWPHKNHRRLIEAMSLLRTVRPDLRLVLTGGRRDALGVLPPWVAHQGHVSDEELGVLYRSAACLAFPSLYEGFGLPPLEAMASGCPVAASRSASLPEVCGDAAYLFDAEDVAGMAAAIDAAMRSSRERVLLGLERARQFTWSNCVEKHVRTYRRAMGQR
jgi:glycosyltransferase involved in cell wall biosynthesis